MQSSSAQSRGAVLLNLVGAKTWKQIMKMNRKGHLIISEYSGN